MISSRAIRLPVSCQPNMIEDLFQDLIAQAALRLALGPYCIECTSVRGASRLSKFRHKFGKFGACFSVERAQASALKHPVGNGAILNGHVCIVPLVYRSRIPGRHCVALAPW